MARRTHTGPVPAALTRPVAVTVDQRRTVAMAASLLLAYPEESFDARVAAVAGSLDGVPGAVEKRLRAFLDAARGLGPRGLQSHYVETFDQRRRCSLYLSYYSVGDTRQRGNAILAFRQQLAGLGIEERTEELPDHLCVLLEALARVDDARHDAAVEMLASHREGIEVLRSALEQLGSPYLHLVVAIAQVLPEVDAATADRYINLIKQGPPAELVGITQLPFPTAQPDHI